MPVIQLPNAPPSSIEKKRQLLAALTATCAQVMGICPDTIRVILQEVPREGRSGAGASWPSPRPGRNSVGQWLGLSGI
ncbi:tautomerase family protein [Arthrobacter sp. RHLT1-20]